MGKFDRQGHGDGLHGLRQIVGREDAADFGVQDFRRRDGCAVIAAEFFQHFFERLPLEDELTFALGGEGVDVDGLH